MMKIQAFTCIVLVAALVQSTSSIKCEADHDCPQQQYCYGAVSRICTQCVSCAYYKRAVSKPTCARSALDCGECLPGFEEESLTYSKRHYCMPTPLPETTSPHTSTHVSEAALSMYVVTCIVSVIGLLFCLGGFIWCKGKRMRTGTSAHQDVEDPVCNNHPPPYEEGGNHIDIPLLEIPICQPLQVTSKNETESSFSLHVQDRGDQSLSQANPFQQAREPYGTNQFSYEDDQDLPNELSDIESHPSLNGPNLNEEETMPSSWTYHDETSTDDAVAAEDFNDSGLSMPSSHTTSTGSLTDPLRLPVERTIVFAVSFAGCIQPPSEERAGADSKRHLSPAREKTSAGPVKRVRGNSSDDEPEASPDRVMDVTTSEDRNDSEQYMSPSRSTFNITLADSTQLMADQGTVVFSLGFAGLANTDNSNKESVTKRVSINMYHHKQTNGSCMTSTSSNTSSDGLTDEDLVNLSEPNVPQDQVIE